MLHNLSLSTSVLEARFLVLKKWRFQIISQLEALQPVRPHRKGQPWETGHNRAKLLHFHNLSARHWKALWKQRLFQFLRVEMNICKYENIGLQLPICFELEKWVTPQKQATTKRCFNVVSVAWHRFGDRNVMPGSFLKNLDPESRGKKTHHTKQGIHNYTIIIPGRKKQSTIVSDHCTKKYPPSLHIATTCHYHIFLLLTCHTRKKNVADLPNPFFLGAFCSLGG